MQVSSGNPATQSDAGHNKLFTTIMNGLGLQADDGGPVTSFVTVPRRDSATLAVQTPGMEAPVPRWKLCGVLDDATSPTLVASVKS